MSFSVTFDEESHTYAVDGQPVDSVTTILKSLGLDSYAMVDPDVLERARVRGCAVDQMITQEVRGELDLGTMDPSLLEPYDAWMRFLDLSGFQPLLCQHVVYSRRYNFIGTLDLAGTLPSKRAGGRQRKVVIDAKNTALVMPSAYIQTAAYERALAEQNGIAEPIERYVLHLKGGKFKLVPCNDRRDWIVFQSALNIHNWKKDKR